MFTSSFPLPASSFQQLPASRFRLPAASSFLQQLEAGS
jgi:hypothetical protein